MKGANSKISLITIEYDISDDQPEHTNVFRLEPSSRSLVENVLSHHHGELSQTSIATIAEFSEGNARVALALAQTAHHGESLANLNDGDLFKRLFRQKNADDPLLLRAAKVCSLVYSFDVETSEADTAELPILAELAEQSCSELHGHVAELYRRQLVQKRSNWRAILPHALAHRLAKLALQDIPQGKVERSFIQNVPTRLLRSFSRRLGCLHDSEEARKLVKAWLNPGGWLSELNSLSQEMLTVLENIAPVAPREILTAIQRNYDRVAGSEFEVGLLRDEIVSLLRSIAYEPDLFDDAVRMLVIFARREGEAQRLREARPIFESLFQLYLSGTNTLQHQRAEILRRLAVSVDGKERELAITGLKSMLRCSHFTSSYGFEFGTRKRDYGYAPDQASEFDAWFQYAFNLCLEFVRKHEALAEPVKKLVANRFRELCESTGMTTELVALADGLHAHGGWSQGWSPVRGAIKAADQAERPSDARKLRALARRLEPSSTEDLIECYVVPDDWSARSIADVDFDDDRKFDEARRQIEAVAREIGRRLAQDPSLLTSNLPTLVASKSSSIRAIGEEIGSASSEPLKAWESITKAYFEQDHTQQASSLLSGFLIGLTKLKEVVVDQILEKSLGDKRLQPYFVWLQSCVGVEVGYDRLLRAAENSEIPIHTFSSLGHGRSSDGLGTDDFALLLRKISQREGGLDVALEILRMRYFGVRSDRKSISPSEKAIGRELLKRLAFDKQNRRSRGPASIVEACLSAPDDEPIARQLCSDLREAVITKHEPLWDHQDLVKALATTFPDVVLDILVEQGETGHSRRWSLFRHFRDEKSNPLDKIDDTIMVSWAKSGPVERFESLARAIRIWDKDPEGPTVEWSSGILRLISEAPDPTFVLNSLLGRLVPSSWSGSRADAMQARLPLLNALGTLNDDRISGWVREAVHRFEEWITQEREREAATDRARDERFDW